MLIQLVDPRQPTKETLQPDSAIGIDLGTTHSVVAVSKEGGQVTVLENEQGNRLIPSVVAYTDQGIIVGTQAKAHQNHVSSIKRLMGKRTVSDVSDRTYHMVESSQGIRLQCGDVTKSPIEISSDILKHLKKMAETSLGEPVSSAVITVPAYFDEAARQETKEAAKLAGLNVLRLINEPTAAALAYGLDQMVEGIYAVYDFGGGTFDVSIIRFTKGVFQVISTAGDTALGGDDIDNLIAKIHGISVVAARQIKEDLSLDASINEPLSLSQQDLTLLVDPIVTKTLGICQLALDDADLTVKQLDGVVLVGGSTRMPAVREAVEQFFGQIPLINLNPDEVVAMGAARQAEALTFGSDTLLLDVTPLSLGIETMGEIVEKIIHRNTGIPVAIAQEFTTYEDGQDALIVHVVQGEREFVKDCRSLATFTLTGIPAMAAGVARIRITFALDVDGLLTVSAKEMTTGVSQQVEINPAYGLQEQELLRILQDNFDHGASDIEQRFLIETRLEAEQFISMLTTALDQDGDVLEPTERREIDLGIDRLRNSLSSESKDDIKAQSKVIEALTQEFADRRINRNLRRALSGQKIDHV